MKKIISILTLIGMILLLTGGVLVMAIEIKDELFKDNKYKMDTKTICDKEKEVKPFIDKKILGIKIGEYQDLRCAEDYLNKPYEKIIDTKLIKEDKTSGLIKIENE